MIKKISVMVVFASMALANNWFNMNPAVHPNARQDGHLVYDSESDRVVLFGGRTTSGASYETWSYDLNNNIWEQMSDAPMAMSFHALVYDSAYDRVIAFYGGVTMVYNFNTDTWEDMNPSPAPAANWGAMMAYDSERDSVVLYGGDGGPYETWEYDLNTDAWMQITTANLPGASDNVGLTYDSESKSVVLFGGQYLATYFDETWVYPDSEVGIEEYAKVKMRKLTIYPNPFVKSCKIPENRSRVEIFDVSGRLINRISGEIWNGEDMNGNMVKSGVYFLKIKGNGRIKVIKL